MFQVNTYIQEGKAPFIRHSTGKQQFKIQVTKEDKRTAAFCLLFANHKSQKQEMTVYFVHFDSVSQRQVLQLCPESSTMCFLYYLIKNMRIQKQIKAITILHIFIQKRFSNYFWQGICTLYISGQLQHALQNFWAQLVLCLHTLILIIR